MALLAAALLLIATLLPWQAAGLALAASGPEAAVICHAGGGAPGPEPKQKAPDGACSLCPICAAAAFGVLPAPIGKVPLVAFSLGLAALVPLCRQLPVRARRIHFPTGPPLLG